MTKDDIKAAVHEALDERDHPCFLTCDQQSDAVDGVKVIHIMRKFIHYGVAIFILGGGLVGVLGWAFWSPITTFFTG